MSNIQQERFFIPMGLSEVDRIAGQPIYSSDATKSNFISCIRNEQPLRRIFSTINQLVDDNVIIPAYANSGVISSLMNKTFANKISGEALGFFVPEKNKIYILVDANSRIFWKSGHDLASVTLHELMHWTARNNTYKFFSKFKRPLLEYYQLFFKMCADIEVSPDNLWRMTQYIFDTFELGPAQKDDLDKLETFYLTNISKDEEKVARILIPLNIFILKPERFFNEINTDKMINKVAISLLESYRDVFGILKPETTPIQELIFPSEIAAVSSVKPTSEHYLVF